MEFYEPETRTNLGPLSADEIIEKYAKYCTCVSANKPKKRLSTSYDNLPD